MINLVLRLPLVFCFVLFLFQNRTLNNLLLTLYSLVHLSLGVCYFIKPEALIGNSYFILNSTNIIFYLVLSVIFLCVAIYNNGYSRNLYDKFSIKKMTLYAVMVLAFVLSMTGGILASNLGLAWIFIEGTT